MKKRLISLLTALLALSLCLFPLTALAQDGEELTLIETEETEESEEAEMPADPSQRVGPGGAMPEWYPVDPEHFPLYHDDSAPRVVDDADIFTDAEEAALTARLTEIRGEVERDIVIFTDTSTYGLSRQVYAADFYDFNGYGWGEEREGLCLFLCMDPNSRGWWCCCTGEKTKAMYTETAANQVDDMLYPYMVDGDYARGVADWIENIRRLCLTGSPYMPDWALLSKDTYPRTHDASAPRVVDDAGLLTDRELEGLEQRALEISGKYGVDVVIHTARSSGTMSQKEFAGNYYYFGGYGLGDSYDGIMFTVYKLPGYYYDGAVTSGFGSVEKKLTETAEDRLVSRAESLIEDENYYGAMMGWLDQTDHFLKTGRAPRSLASWLATLVLALAAGGAFGGISLAIARKRMATPKLQENADAYLVKGSLSVQRVADLYLRSATSRRYDPVEDRSSGGSSSGGSSYSSSYSGSSGSSHSGSGRDF